MDEMELDTISGTVQTVIYQNEDNGYSVLCIVTESGDEVTVVGTLPQIGLGEELYLAGTWTTHPSYGEQFKTEYFERRLPATAKGIADYLSSGMIKGIGPKLAARIVDYRAANGPFQSPEELMNVSGIGEKTYAGLAEQITAGAANQEGTE